MPKSAATREAPVLSTPDQRWLTRRRGDAGRWYGRLVGEPNALMPRNPVDLAAELKAPVLRLYGAADQGIPVATTEQMQRACAAAGKTCEFVVYPDTPHAFYADHRPSYRAGPATDGWSRLQAWFKQYGAA